jgi:hypothetical protein
VVTFNRTVVLSTIAQDKVAWLRQIEPEFRRVKAEALEKGGSIARDYAKMNRQILPEALTAIVFGAFAIESCIYSLIYELKDDEVSQLINDSRMQTADRWRILLWRLTGEFLSTGEGLGQSLQRVVKVRNQIVHSKPIELDQKGFEKLKEFDEINEAKHAVETIRDLDAYLQRFAIRHAHSLLFAPTPEESVRSIPVSPPQESR